MTAILETTLGMYYNYIFFKILVIILLQVIIEKKYDETFYREE